MKKYILFLRPHANARYEAESVRLSVHEAQALLGCGAVLTDASDEYGVPCLAFACEEDVSALKAHSLLYLLCEREDDGRLLPVLRAPEPRIGRDLAGILKYSGKTNESFTDMMLNLALTASSFSGDGKISVLDPMCGKGTTVYLAANRGWNGYGSDMDRKSVNEACTFLKKYLEYHKMIHERAESSLTLRSKPAARCVKFDVFRDREHQKDGLGVALSFTNLDARDVRDAFGKERFHLIVTDLPYGVQHETRGNETLQLLEKALPAWYAALKKGGACTVSFNANTLKRADAEAAFERAGFAVCRSEAYSDLSHWVEQAITRDCITAVKQETGGK